MIERRYDGQALVSAASALLAIVLCVGPRLRADCNLNGIPDRDDLSSGTSADCNANSIPDECERFRSAVGGESLPLGAQGTPRGVALGDFNGDGLTDLAVADDLPPDASNVALFYSQAPGALDPEPNRQLSIDARVFDLAAGDLDSDGDVDLVSVHSEFLQFLVNSGTGDFTVPAPLPLPNFARQIRIADLSGDGNVDLVVSNPIEDRMFVLLGSGGGNFGEAAGYAVGDKPLRFAVADLNGDGSTDIVVANETSLTLSVLWNDGSGAFGAPLEIEVGDSLRFADAADFDGDGDIDLVAGGRNLLKIWINESSGNFVEKATYFVAGSRIACADFDLDGHVDLAVGAFVPGIVSVLWNRGDGSFAGRVDVSVAADAFAAEDLDDDGDPDLISGAGNPTHLTISWNSDDGVRALVAPAKYRAFARPHDITIGDFDGDGLPDIVTANSGDGSFSFLKGHGDGTFDGGFLFQRNHLFFSLTKGDYDQDGNLDLAFYAGASISLFFNDGHGGFSERIVYKTRGAGPRATTADVTGDGFPEILAPNAGADHVTVLFNGGDGTFNEQSNYLVGDSPVSVAAADIDGDGHVDLATANRGSADVSVIFNQGARTFSAPEMLLVSGRPISIAAADFNGDGNVDLTTGNNFTNDIAVWLQLEDGTFDSAVTFPLTHEPTNITVLDANSDGNVDVASTSEKTDTVALALGRGDGTFLQEQVLPSGLGPRFSAVGDIDLDGDDDLATGNRQGQNVTVFQNNAPRPITDLFLEKICTELDFENVSVARTADARLRATKFVAPARGDDTELLPTLFQNVRIHRLHQEFLAAAFPERFPNLALAEYNRLTAVRATRDYFAGAITQLRLESGEVVYGFDVAVDNSDPQELLTLDEVRDLHGRLEGLFLPDPLGYAPSTFAARERAANWVAPGFPIFDDTLSSGGDYTAYVRGVTFGRVRLMTREEFDDADRSGGWSLQTIVVVDEAPSDIRGIVGGVITGAPQSELSHLLVRLARRGTPNAFVAQALERLQSWDGQLVRLDVDTTSFTVEAASLDEATEFWASRGRTISVEPQIDPNFRHLATFEEINALDAPTAEFVPEARFGGKASNLARLQTVLTGDWSRYRERGFAVPIAHYLEFLRANTIGSIVDGRTVTYEESLLELFADGAFRSDPQVRVEALRALRQHMRTEGRVDPVLIQSIVARIEEVLGTPRSVRVRHRSSSNAEDALEFNGAGLYDSTAACIADQVDGDDVGPSLCDERQENERTIERALKRVWSSLWNFGAYEERDFFGIPQEMSAMAVLVNRAFVDEKVNGVAFTGNPSNAADRRYVITAQVGDVSVVSPPPGVLSEKSLLEVAGGEVVRILRASPSTLVEDGEFVMSDAKLSELGALMAHIDENFAVELGGVSRDQVLLDMEFKVLPDESLAVKQVRPFLLTEKPPPTPTFELLIPPGTEMCGVFAVAGVNRGLREEYELKSHVRFRAGPVPLPTLDSEFEVDLFDAVVIGPEETQAIPVGPGRMRVQVIPPSAARPEETIYRFTYSQDFHFGDDRSLTIELVTPLVLRARGDEPIGPSPELDEAFFTRSTGTEMFRARVEDMPLIQYGSCSYASLPLWSIETQLEDGTQLQLEERYDPASSEFETGPASLVRAEVTLGGSHQVIHEYFQLVYSAFRHNAAPRYWVVLDAPVNVAKIAEQVHAVELTAPEGDGQATATYLDADFEPLRRLEVTSYQRNEADDRPRFRRGDVTGDGAVDVSDPIALLNFIFRDGAPPACGSAADANDDGRHTLTDAVVLILHLFRGFGPLPAPAATCGADPTPDDLPCAEPPAC